MYLKGRIVGDYTLPNQEQWLIEKKISNFEKAIKHPSHLGVFILAYSKVIMNDLIFHMHGFDHWDNAFYYTDTDSLIIHASLLKMIPSELLGNDLGQAHDDVNGKIIRAVFVRPKLYCLEILSSNGYIKYHKRCKGIPSKNVDSITIEDFYSMIRDETVLTQE